jgi:hypothetical protein
MENIRISYGTDFAESAAGLGMFALTPYLALTSYDSKAPTESSAVSALVGSRAFGIFQLASTLVAYMYAFGLFAPNDINGV